MTWVAACVFSLIAFSVLSGFQPAQELLCSRYVGVQSYPDKSCFRNALFEYQTLLAGIAAVIGVAWTVSQMRKADELASMRHDTLVALSLKPEYAALRRFIFPQMVELIQAHIQAMNLHTSLGNHSANNLKAHADLTKSLFDNVRGILERDVIESTQSYFDGELLLWLTKLKDAIREGKEAVDRTVEFQDSNAHSEYALFEFDNWFSGSHGDKAGLDSISEGLGACLEFLPRIIEKMEQIKKKLDRLQKTYPDLE